MCIRDSQKRENLKIFRENFYKIEELGATKSLNLVSKNFEKIKKNFFSKIEEIC